MKTKYHGAKIGVLPGLLIALLAACAGGAPAGAPAPAAAAATEAMAASAATTITATDMARRIGALAHDSMRGRDTPSPELEQAAEYLAREFRGMGLEPAGDDDSFIQRWVYNSTRLDADRTTVRPQGADASPVRYGRDFFLVPSGESATSAGVFFAGTAGETGPLPGEARGAFLLFDLPGDEVGMAWQQRLMAALQPTVMGGAAGLIVVLDPEFPDAMIGQLAQATAAEQAPIPVAGLSREAAQRLLGAAGADLGTIRAAGGPTVVDARLEITSNRVQERHTPPNVVAMARGSDPVLRDTYVVITAHFDHVGIGTPDETGDSIFNGADDNASGTAAVLEVAHAFASMPRAPARSVLFLAVSGEEKGLLGSRAFVENPTVPIDAIVANINLDMIGRNAPDTIIGIGQEYSTLEGTLQRITDTYPELGLTVILDPEPEKMFFFRSDQLAFIQQGIPAVFLNAGDHDDYHRQSDRPEHIDNDKAARVARLAFHLAFAIANDPVRPEWTEAGWRRVEQMLSGGGQ